MDARGSVRPHNTTAGRYGIKSLPTELILILMVFTALLLDDPPAFKERLSVTHVCRG
ncbi:hypothetical protein CALCODRAFT_503840 [Calocera cornea HHB12733]|uniref:Uncharacterized protein n=1 Tax=Calocera cornea HHB12733 TaxID=1353952 RepID=A0A165CQ70_9BASI|nr:hypothetical protein CALCODRAFT_503840 [Calocera cornea HHB12733]